MAVLRHALRQRRSPCSQKRLMCFWFVSPHAFKRCVCVPLHFVFVLHGIATFTFGRCQPSQCQLQPLVQPRAAISSNDRTESSYGKPTVNNEHVLSPLLPFCSILLSHKHVQNFE